MEYVFLDKGKVMLTWVEGIVAFRKLIEAFEKLCLLFGSLSKDSCGYLKYCVVLLLFFVSVVVLYIGSQMNYYFAFSEFIPLSTCLLCVMSLILFLKSKHEDRSRRVLMYFSMSVLSCFFFVVYMWQVNGKYVVRVSCPTVAAWIVTRDTEEEPVRLRKALYGEVALVPANLLEKDFKDLTVNCKRKEDKNPFFDQQTLSGVCSDSVFIKVCEL